MPFPEISLKSPLGRILISEPRVVTAGKTMYSDQFTVPVQGKLTKWRLKMYPNGRKAVDQGYVTLFLKDSGREQPANLRAQVKFSVVNAKNDLINTKTIDKEYKVLNHAFGKACLPLCDQF